jgi:hypothetical protein
LGRRSEGVRVALLSSLRRCSPSRRERRQLQLPSLNDLALELELKVDMLDPTEPEDEFVRMEFEREAEEYDPDEE